mgnify:CR=1 FL=1
MNQNWIQLLPEVLSSQLDKGYQLKKILGNISWLFVDRLLRMGLELVVGMLVARYLGPSQFGLFNYAIAFVSIFGVIAALGLDSIVVRELVNHSERQASILGTTFILKTGGSIIAWLLTIYISYLFIFPDRSQVHWLICITASILFFKPSDTVDFWFQSRTQSKYTALVTSTTFILFATFRLGLIAFKLPLTVFALAGLLEAVLRSVGLIIVSIKEGLPFKQAKFCHQTAKQLIIDGFPLIFSAFLIMIYMRVDQIMLAEMAGSTEVGLYSSAVKLAESWYFVSLIIVPSVFPNLLETKQVSESAFLSKLQSLYNFMAISSYFISVPVTVCSGWIVYVLFGPEYSNAAPMLSILIWTTVFVNLGVARNSFLTAMNWTRLSFMTIAIGCVINIALNILLIPLYGGIGAAISTLIAYGFATYISCFMIRELAYTAKMLTKSIFFPIKI